MKHVSSKAPECIGYISPMPPRIHIIQHVDFEGPAAILEWVDQQKSPITYTRQWLLDPLPNLESFDFLIVMGGPMSVHDKGEHPWMESEISFVGKAILAEKAVLGICLGAQVMSISLGGMVSRNPVNEIGFLPVQRSSSLEIPWRALVPSEFTPLHWHGETFSIPPKATILGSSKACQNQGFLWGERALGLQFHLEATTESVELLLQNSQEELAQGGEFVQNLDQLKSGIREQGASLQAILFFWLDQLAFG